MRTLEVFKSQNTGIGGIKKALSGVAVAAALLISSTAHSALLNIPSLFPDIVSQGITVDYNAGTDLLTANGTALQLAQSNTNTNAIAGGSFSFTVDIDDGGNASNGSFTIGGTIDALTFNSGTLLTGTLSTNSPNFGFAENNSGILDFIFTITGGDAAVLYGGVGSLAGMILSSTGFDGTSGSFGGSDFGSNTASADVGAVPVPAAMWLFGSGLLGLVAVRRRKSDA